MRTRRPKGIHWIAILPAAILLAGCGEPAPPPVKSWPELQAFRDAAYNLEVTLTQDKNFRAAKKEAESFTKVVDDFEQAGVPSGFSTYQPAATQALELSRKLIDAISNASYTKAQQLVQQLSMEMGKLPQLVPPVE
ncbi:hypothetical protein Pan216_47290 [Planctomycetes bacterium Pan216]|uniref:DUF4398 domain-containing protein n=1 Tax=Kolteria novifilia TaxID=2527975 RepID=A0A518BA39_9BACT|nr:hypothetical protein Pan216_47290 [Planctomycetes bacterium Pan216]